MIWLLLIPAYLLGTFPSAVWIARSKGVDITKVGSGNPGASNIARTFGKRWGLLVFFLDGLKGAIPGLGGVLLDDRVLAWGLVAAAVVGHMFPVTRRFQGGKGVATVGGAAIAIHPIVAAVVAAVWFLVLKVTHKSSLASLTAMVSLPVGFAIAGATAAEVLVVVGVNLVVMARHWQNIRRLLTGTELSSSKQK